MTRKIELIPISEGNRITVKENEKIIVGRGSSLGCNDKKISRHHAELLFKKDEKLWIKSIHTNPVFYRPSNGKTTQLIKDIEQELKDGDQIGLLPTNFFFRISFSTDGNDSHACKKENELSAVGVKSSEQSSSTTISEKKTPDVEPKSYTPGALTSPSVKDQDESESINSDQKARTLPKWMATSTSSSPHDSSSSDRPSTKRQLSAEGDSNANDAVGTKSPSKPSVTKSFDSDSEIDFDSVSTKKIKSSDKRRPPCQYGKSCYRKNPLHRTEQSHPDDSDYEDQKQTNNDKKADDDRPECPYGKTCYRQNSQHKQEYKH